MKRKHEHATPRCLLEKNRYQAVPENEPLNRLQRRPVKSIKRKVRKVWITANIIENLKQAGAKQNGH